MPIISALPASILEHIRRLSGKWQPEWMPVCTAFRDAAMADSRDGGRHVVLPLWHDPKEALRLSGMERARRQRDTIHLVSAQWMFPAADLRLRPKIPKAFPLPERVFAPFSDAALAWYFQAHHNLHHVAGCLRLYLEKAAELGLSGSIRSVELFLIQPIEEQKGTTRSNEAANTLTRLLLGLPNLETLKVRVRTGRLRDRQCQTWVLENTPIMGVLISVVANSASIRNVVLTDASLPGARWFGAGLLALIQAALTNDSKEMRPTRGRSVLRLENVRLLDWRSEFFWNLVGECQCVSRLELVNTGIAWPRGAIFSGAARELTIRVSGGEQGDPAVFAAEGVVFERVDDENK